VHGSKGKLLIIEDDSALRRSLRTTLGVLGFDVAEASNGEDALVQLRTVDARQIYLLNINMPRMGGIETFRRIRNGFTRLPILTLTVRDDEDDDLESKYI
jgi:two-component system KDP operon response regulator KdpE